MRKLLWFEVKMIAKHEKSMIGVLPMNVMRRNDFEALEKACFQKRIETQ